MGLLFNLGLLAYFKYRNFLIENIELLFIGSSHSFEKFSAIIIPLGISFYTFQQIAILIDARDGTIKTPPPFLHFVQFITFFPQLIAGPIVLLGAVLCDFADDPYSRERRAKGSRLVRLQPGPGRSPRTASDL